MKTIFHYSFCQFQYLNYGIVAVLSFSRIPTIQTKQWGFKSFHARMHGLCVCFGCMSGCLLKYGSSLEVLEYHNKWYARDCPQSSVSATSHVKYRKNATLNETKLKERSYSWCFTGV